MIRCAPVLALTVCFLATGTALGQVRYTLKFKEVGKGDSHQVDQQQKITESVVVKGAKGAKPGDDKEQKHTITEQFTFVETVLERLDTDQLPTKVRRAYSKAVIKDDAADKENKALSFQGKTVLVEKKTDPKAKVDYYEARIEGGKDEPMPDLNLVERDFEDLLNPALWRKALLPKQAVAVNQSWDVDAASIVKRVLAKDADTKKDFKFDIIKANAKAKLVKVYQQKDGKQFGIIEIEAALTVKMFIKDDPAVKGSVNSEDQMTITGKLDMCIDGSAAAGSASLVVTNRTETKIDGKDEKVQIVENITRNIERRWSAVTKK